MATEYYFAFWNLENLFDIEKSPRRSEKLERAIGKDLKGWTQTKRDKKIAQLSSIIRRMNGGKGPDLLGVCEVENAHVMQLLADSLAPLGRTYQVVHHDTSDQRGIDVGFIYDSGLFTAGESFSHVVMRRTATRDIFQVNFTTKKNRRFVVMGNHWPSRSGGRFESDGYRAIAGETLAYFHERVMDVLGKTTPVIAMGDFNDEPFDRSLVDYALSVQLSQKAANARNYYFLNLMWDILGRREGTLYYDGVPNVLDQFLVNKNMIANKAAFRALPETVEVIRFPEMVDKGDYPKCIRYGTGKDTNPNGFSDHFPVGVKIVEKD